MLSIIDMSMFRATIIFSISSFFSRIFFKVLHTNFQKNFRCYREATKLSQNNSLVWHDLGTCYLNHALIDDDVEKKKNLLTYAMVIIRYCVEANPNNWQHWNLMGVIAMSQGKYWFEY